MNQLCLSSNKVNLKVILIIFNESVNFNKNIKIIFLQKLNLAKIWRGTLLLHFKQKSKNKYGD